MTDTPMTSDPRYTHPDRTWEAQLLSGVSVTNDSQVINGRNQEANEVVDDIVVKLATLTVRRQCNQHACTLPTTGACEHEDARRDADYLRHVLDVLGLPGDFQRVTENDRANLLTALARKPTINSGQYADISED